MIDQNGELAKAGAERSAGKPSSPRRVTMQDVADKAGVHQTTVSIALRHHPSIPLETRERILAVARELGYRKDPQLDAFNRYRVSKQGRRCEKIAFLTDRPDREAFAADPALSAYFEGARGKAEEMNCELQVVSLAEGSARSLADRLRGDGFTSVVVARLTKGKGLDLEWKEWPAVGIDQFDLEFELDVFAPDYRRATRKAVSELHRAGYRRIGYFSPTGGDPRLNDLCQIGFLIEARLKGLPVLLSTRSGPDADESTLLDWIQEDDLEAVVCVDESSCGKVGKLGWSAGRELAVCSLDWSAQRPAMAGVDLRRPEVGKAAIVRLAEIRSSGWLAGSQGSTVTYLPTEWVAGISAPGAQPLLRGA